MFQCDDFSPTLVLFVSGVAMASGSKQPTPQVETFDFQQNPQKTQDDPGQLHQVQIGRQPILQTKQLRVCAKQLNRQQQEKVKCENSQGLIKQQLSSLDQTQQKQDQQPVKQIQVIQHLPNQLQVTTGLYQEDRLLLSTHQYQKYQPLDTQLQYQKDQLPDTQLQYQKDQQNQTTRPQVLRTEDQVQDVTLQFQKDQVQDVTLQFQKNQLQDVTLQFQKDQLQDVTLQFQKNQLQDVTLQFQKDQLQDAQLQYQKYQQNQTTRPQALRTERVQDAGHTQQVTFHKIPQALTTESVCRGCGPLVTSWSSLRTGLVY